MSEGSTSHDRSSSLASSPGAAIELYVNGEPHQVASPCTVAGLLAELGLTGERVSGKRVAVAVNREVVIRARYAEVALCPGDRIEILEAVGGG